MILNDINIKNFRSIENVDFEIKKIKDSRTYALLGINESGKSSFLQAISLIDNGNIEHPTDFFDSEKRVEISLNYTLTDDDKNKLNDVLLNLCSFPEELISKVQIQNVVINIKFENDVSAEKSIYENINFKKGIFSNYTVTSNQDDPTVRDGEDETQGELDLNDYFFENQHLKDFFWSISHKVIFWKSSPEYLVLDEIQFTQFSASPETVSIPMMNCFQLAGINKEDIPTKIKSLTTPSDIQNLQTKLGSEVTKHIKSIWPEHPVSVSFLIDSNKITLLVEDDEVEFNAKTTKQRSDGFRQFISFLLSVSVQSTNEELSNTILLIDEPEIHLHPPAQLNLLKELIKISNNKRNNIVLFATHSNYLIDKQSLNRNYKVVKNNNEKTEITKIDKEISTYSEVNFDIFEIPTTDYHNELYGYLEDVDKAKLNALPKDREWINVSNGTKRDVSLSTYIRHSIHHPENTTNRKYTEAQLVKSIKILRELKCT